jgi:hypothetical protein
MTLCESLIFGIGPIYVGRRRETLYTARGEQFVIRRSAESAAELGVYLVVLPSTYWERA